MAASSSIDMAAGEGLHYVQEGMEPVSAEQLNSYSTFSSYPTDGPTPVSSFDSTFHQGRKRHRDEKISSHIHHAQTQPPDLPIDPKGWRRCRIPRRILLWIIPSGLILSWLVAGLVGYEIKQANKNRSALFLNNSEDSSGSNITITVTATATTTTTTTASLASVATPTTTAANDLAGCPANNGTTYKSGSYTYIKICGIDFIGSDLQNDYKASFEACMDSCTAYNTAHADNASCVGATYDIFTPSNFSDNERCFLKYGKGVPTATSRGKISDSGLIVSM